MGRTRLRRPATGCVMRARETYAPMQPGSGRRGGLHFRTAVDGGLTCSKLLSLQFSPSCPSRARWRCYYCEVTTTCGLRLALVTAVAEFAIPCCCARVRLRGHRYQFEEFTSDSAAANSLPPGHRRPQPFPGPADHVADAAIDSGVWKSIDQRVKGFFIPCWCLKPESLAYSFRSTCSFFSCSGNDADPHVFPDRIWGTNAAFTPR